MIQTWWTRLVKWWDRLIRVEARDEEEVRLGRLFNTLMWISTGTATAIAVVFVVLWRLQLVESFPFWVAVAFPVAYLPLSPACLLWAKRGRVRAVARFYAWVNFVSLSLAILLFDGLLSPAWPLQLWTVVVAGTLVSPAFALTMVGLLAGYGALLAVLGGLGVYSPPLSMGAGREIATIAFAMIMLVSTGGLLTYLNMRSLREALVRLKVTTQELEKQRLTLEQRVAERTAELAHRTAELARRTAQLEAAAAVARRAAEIRDLDALLNEAVRLISDRFGFYHVGIFLIDDAGEYAVLRAASSEGGQRMLARGYRLAVGKVGIVGTVAGTGKPRIVLDVGKDAVFSDNPDLPRTRSEMALPLKVGERVIGVLDVQSEEPEAFTEEDVAVLQTMADQIALAIENARLLEESRRAVEELRTLYGERVREAWERLEGLPPALVYDRVSITPKETLPPVPAIEEALRQGQVIALQEPDNGRAVLAAPLRLHGRVIGAIALEEADEARLWTEDEIALVQAVSEQVALALESARLYQMEQRRRFVADTLQEIARVVGSTLDLEEVTDRLLDQLERLIPFDAAVIHLLVGERREIVGGRGVDLETTRRWLEKQPPVSEDRLLAEVIRTRAPVVIADTHVDPRWKRRGARSAMAVPMVLGEKVIGFLLVDHHQPDMYDEEMAALATAVAAQAAVAVQNARLYSEARERAMEQEGLARIAALAVSTLELEPLLEGVLREAVPLVESEGAALLLYDDDTRSLQTRYILLRGEFLHEAREWQIPVDAPGMEQSIFARGGAYYSNLGAADPNLIPAYLPYMERLGVQNFCGVALRVREESIGELYFLNRPRGFGRSEVRLARAIAGYIANALANARLFEEARLRAEELAVLNELGQALTARLDVQQVLEEAYRGVSRLLDTTNFYIALYDPQQNIVSFPLVIEENQRRPYRACPFANGLTEYIIRNKKPVLIEESVSARLQEMGVDQIGRAAQSWLGVPLMVGDQVLGVMAVQSYTTLRAYDEHDLNLLTAVASQVAIALQNARSYEEAQRRAERERLARQIVERIQAAPDTESVLRVAVQELGRALRTSRTFVQLGIPEDGGGRTPAD